MPITLSIIVGTLLPCGHLKCLVLHVNALCGMLHMVYVYTNIVDAFQPIDTFCAIVTKKGKEGQRKHHGAVIVFETTDTWWYKFNMVRKP